MAMARLEAAGPGAALTLRGGTVVNGTSVERRDVHILGDRFTHEAATGGLTVDAGGCWIFPGFINAHDHLHLNCLPPLTGLGVFPNAYRWIDAAQARRADPVMARAEQVPIGLRLWHGGLRNLLSGVTTVVHHDPRDSVFDQAGFPVRVPEHYGWCHSLGLSGTSGDSDLRYGPGLRESMTRATSRWFIHLAEGTDAVAAAELLELDRLGGLSERTVLVHATGLRRADFERVREAGAWVVWCPASNLALLGRTFDPRAPALAGRLALGTDSRLTGSADMLAEMRLAARTGPLAASVVLRLVTEDAAHVIDRPDLGAIAPGRTADLVLVPGDTRDPHETLLSCTRGDLAAVVRGGQPLLASERFWPWMNACVRDIAEVVVDGHLRRCPRPLLGPPGASALEPGIEVLTS